MATPDTRTGPSTRSILTASLVGTSIEWYDYYVFGTASALVFGSLFFPEFSPVAGTLAAFATFAVGFAARPLGAAVIGHFGDRIGRKSMLVLTLLLAGAATFLIGLLPTYAAIGVGAPFALVVLRLAQGFGVGGEWGGAVLIATESASPRRRAVYGSFAQFGVPIGVLTSNAAFLIVSALAGDQFASWGWRVPFLVSIVLVVIGIVARARLTDTAAFRQVKRDRRVARVPIGDLVRGNGWNLLLASVAAIAPPAVGYTVIVYMLTYGTTVVGFDRTTLLTLILCSTVVWIATIFGCAILADRVGAKRVYAIGALTAVIWPLPLFALVNTGLEPGVEPDLREVHLGEWEGGLLRKHSAENHPIALRVRREERWDLIPGAEPAVSFAARVRAGITRLADANPGRRIAVVSHGGTIGQILAQAAGSRPFAFQGADNGSISHLVVDGERWIIRCFNDTTHLTTAFTTSAKPLT